MSDAAPLLDVRDLHCGYHRERPVLRGATLAVQEGELCCVLGPNGCGKTTLLRCLLGLVRVDTGSVRLAGHDAVTLEVAHRARLLSYVPQVPRTTFDFTVLEVVLMARYAHAGPYRVVTDKDRDIAQAALQMTATEHLAQRTLDELSSGEAQRVMIARAVAQQPRVLLLDEPTSHLDLEHQVRIHQMMRRLAHDWPMAVLCVSHDINLAARFADRLVLMKDGRVTRAGAPREVLDVELLGHAFGVAVDLIPVGDDVPLIRVRD